MTKQTHSSSSSSSSMLVLSLSVLTSVVATLYVAPRQPSILVLLVKLLPCLSLLLYVWLTQHALQNKLRRTTSWNTLLYILGIGADDIQSQSKNKKGNDWKLYGIKLRRKLEVWITRGLIFAIVGDAFLVWHELEVPFLCGMLAFGAMQFCYIKGLGFEKVNAISGVVCYTLGVGLSFLFLSDAPLLFVYTIPCYGALFSTTLWRGIDRCSVRDGRELWQCYAMVAGIVVFLSSDSSIAVFKFLLPDTPQTTAQTIILATYFVGQTLITVGAVHK